MNEIWKDIEGYEGLYQVSNMGNVKSLDRYVKGNNSQVLRKGKLLKLSKCTNGYIKVTLNIEQQHRTFHVHRLVAKAFLINDDPISKNQVNHKDEDKTNNKVDNLEWCTPLYNNAYGTRGKRVSKAQKGNTRSNKRVKCITTGEVFDSIKIAGETKKVDPTGISACCKGKRQYSGKLKDGTKLQWKYI